MAGELDLRGTDGDACDVTIEGFGKVSRSTTEPAADVEDGAVCWKLRLRQEEVDEGDLGRFFGLGGGGEVAVVDVLTPNLFISTIKSGVWNAPKSCKIFRSPNRSRKKTVSVR